MAPRRSRLEVSAKSHVTQSEVSFAIALVVEMAGCGLTGQGKPSSVEVLDAWILVGFKLSASLSQQVFNGAEIFLANTLVLVELGSAACQQQPIDTENAVSLPCEFAKV